MPGIFSGIFPDGVLGRRDVKHNQGLIEQAAERILGDDQARADLENMGQLGSVELLIDRGRQAPNRREQQPVLDALGQIIDGLGLWDRDRVESGKLDQRINESLAAAASFVGPEQREQIAQLADEAARAYDLSQYSPTEGMTAYNAITAKVQKIAEDAGKNINKQYIEPLRRIELETAQTRQQLLDASGGNLQRLADPTEVLQVLNQIGTQSTQEMGGLGIGLNFAGFGFGGVGPDDVPNMTYADLLRVLQSREHAAQSYVQDELDRRGAGVIARAPELSLPTTEQVNDNAASIIDRALESGSTVPPEVIAEAVPPSLRGGERETITTWLRDNNATYDPQTGSVYDAEGNKLNPPPFVMTALEQIKRLQGRRARRARATND